MTGTPAMRLEEDTKSCEVCGGIFSRRTGRRSGESRRIFAQRRFCSPRCRNLAKKVEKPSYSTIHTWIARNWKKMGRCSDCGKERSTQWANLDGLYERERRESWAELCSSCHQIYDKRVIDDDITPVRCGRCKKTKPANQFARNRAQKTGRYTYCWKCLDEYREEKREV